MKKHIYIVLILALSALCSQAQVAKDSIQVDTAVTAKGNIKIIPPAIVKDSIKPPPLEVVDDSIYSPADLQVPAEFPGDISRYLKENMGYPKIDLKPGSDGIVKVRFVVEKDGSLSHIRLMNKISDELDAEALRLARKMPQWKPGIKDEKPVRMVYILSVKFSLD